MELAPDELVPTPSRGVRILVCAAAAVGFTLLFLALGAVFSSESASADEQPALVSDIVDAAIPDFVAEPLAPVTEPVLALVDPIVTPVVAPVLEPVVRTVHVVSTGASTALAVDPVPVIDPIAVIEPTPVIEAAPIDPTAVTEPAEVPGAAPSRVVEPAGMPIAPEPVGSPTDNPATVGGGASATGAADIQSTGVEAAAQSAADVTPERDTPAPFPSFEHDSSPD